MPVTPNDTGSLDDNPEAGGATWSAIAGSVTVQMVEIQNMQID